MGKKEKAAALGITCGLHFSLNPSLIPTYNKD